MFDFYFKIKALCSIVLVCGVSYHAAAQDAYSWRFNEKTLTVGNPEVGRVGLATDVDADVDLTSGALNVTVPLFNISENDIHIPISLSYNTSGVKVNETAGSFGIGWTLSTDCAIEVERRGNDDINYFADVAYHQYPTSISDAKQFIAGSLGKDNIVNTSRVLRYDTEHDVFHYSIFNRSGSFTFKNDQNRMYYYGFHPVILTGEKTLQIQFNGKFSQDLPTPQKFLITDEDGLQYTFKSSESYRIYMKDKYFWERYDHDENAEISGGSSILPWSWNEVENRIHATPTKFYLDKIVSLASGEQVDFVYDSVNYTEDALAVHNSFRYLVPSNPNANLVECTNMPDNVSYNETMFKRTYWKKRLKEIRFRTGKVRYNYSAARADIQNDLILASIELVDLDNVVRRRIELETFNAWADVPINSSYPGYTNIRLGLGAVYDKNLDASASKGLIAQFTYNPTGLPSRMDIQKTDYWGYYNCQSNNPNGIPNFEENGLVHNDGVNKSSDESCMKAMILEKITNGLGGEYTFDYEQNTYFDPVLGANQLTGGLRVKQIKKDGFESMPSIVNNYYYTQPDIPSRSSGTIQEKPEFYQPMHMMVQPVANDPTLPYWQCLLHPEQMFFSGHQEPINRVSPLIYNYVTVAQPGNGRVVHKFLSYIERPDQINPCARTLDGINNGGTYEFNHASGRYTMFVPNTSLEDERGLLKAQWYYSEGGQMVKSEINEYNFDYFPNLDEEVISLALSDAENTWAVNNTPNRPGGAWKFYPDEHLKRGFGNYQFAGAYKHISKHVKLVSKVTTEYDDAGNSVATNEEFGYSPTNFALAYHRVNTAGGQPGVEEKSVTYNSDYIAGANLNYPIEWMKSKHILTRTIEATTKLNGNVTGGLLQSYYVANDKLNVSNVFRLEPASPVSNFVTASYSTSTGLFSKDSHYPSLPQRTFDKYDANSNIQQASENGKPSAFIWDYNNKYLVANIYNATRSQVAYTSFESGYGDGWINNQSSVISGGKIGGMSCIGSVQIQNLPAGSYDVGFWAKGQGRAWVGNVSVQINSAADWKYYVTRITTQGGNLIVDSRDHTSVPINPDSDVRIDNLILVPSSSQFKTYTYLPFVGETSVTDQNGFSSFYEYDALNRLTIIRDNFGNIVKSYNYHNRKDR